MQNYVISLKSASERKQHIMHEFSKHNINYNFFDAITPELAQDLINNSNLSLKNTYLSNGELACFMSHFSLWKKVVNENIPYIAIFEDDIYLGKNAEFFLSRNDWIPDNIDIIKLEVTHDKIIIPSSSSINLSTDRKILRLDSAHLGAGAYILSNLCARKLIHYTESLEFLVPIDEILFRNLIENKDFKTYQMVPALCVQDIIINNNNHNSILRSTLVKERGIRMKKESHTVSEKIIRELTRLLRQIKLLLFAKKIKFE